MSSIGELPKRTSSELPVLELTVTPTRTRTVPLTVTEDVSSPPVGTPVQVTPPSVLYSTGLGLVARLLSVAVPGPVIVTTPGMWN